MKKLEKVLGEADFSQAALKFTEPMQKEYWNALVSALSGAGSQLAATILDTAKRALVAGLPLKKI